MRYLQRVFPRPILAVCLSTLLLGTAGCSGMTLPGQSAAVGAATGCGAGALLGGRDGCGVGALVGGAFGYLIGLGVERDLKAKADAYDSVLRQRAQLRENIRDNADLIRDMKRYLIDRRRAFDQLQAQVERGQASRRELKETALQNIRTSETLYKEAREALQDYRAYVSDLSPNTRRRLKPQSEQLLSQLNDIENQTRAHKNYYQRLGFG